MKARKGFVSNSSSSSFICDVCGEQSSGWDMTYQDAEMVCCKNGHEFCEVHLIGGNKTLERLEDEDREDYDEEWRYELPIEYCPICQMEVVTDSDMVKYLLKSLGKTSKDAKKDIRDQFKTFDDLMNYIK